ncbi:MAG: site-2 protease family protein [Sulfurovum sp.]|nr:site-2 protease family protein [Sulfurovum sp.]
MLKNKITLLKLFGFNVRIDSSWIIILFLVIWSLAEGFFPARFTELDEQTYWMMAIAGAMGLFASIIIHEFSHAFIARKYGLKIQNITLFVFGGVAEMKDEPQNPKVEFLMAIAGPIASLLLSVLFSTLHTVGDATGLPIPIIGVLGYLGTINMLLAIFNMLPAFPTDGGRILRSFLWWKKKDIRWATQMASRISLFFAVSIIFIGFVNMIASNVIGGLWWILIGSFLFSAANASYHSLLIKQSFSGKSVRHFMNPSPVTVPYGITLKELVDTYLSHYPHKMYPVTKEDSIVGMITIADIKAVPQEGRTQYTAGGVMHPKNTNNSVSIDTAVNDALVKMNATGASRLLVTENSKAVGIITLKDLLEFIALKMELED